jgi:hypothetical protein
MLKFDNIEQLLTEKKIPCILADISESNSSYTLDYIYKDLKQNSDILDDISKLLQDIHKVVPNERFHFEVFINSNNNYVYRLQRRTENGSKSVPYVHSDSIRWFFNHLQIFYTGICINVI